MKMNQMIKRKKNKQFNIRNMARVGQDYMEKEKIKKIYILPLLLLIFYFPAMVFAASMQVNTPPRSHVVSITSHMHGKHSTFDSLPFDDGDVGCLLAYEFHEGIGFWQAGVEFLNTPEGDPSVDYVLTPQLSLILKDRIYRAGFGVLWNYLKIDDPEMESNWSKPFWQFTLGVGYPFRNKMELSAYSYYIFEEWEEFGNFNFEDIEYGISLSYRF